MSLESLTLLIGDLESQIGAIAVGVPLVNAKNKTAGAQALLQAVRQKTSYFWKL